MLVAKSLLRNAYVCDFRSLRCRRCHQHKLCRTCFTKLDKAILMWELTINTLGFRETCVPNSLLLYGIEKSYLDKKITELTLLG